MSKEFQESPTQEISVTPVTADNGEAPTGKKKIGEGKWWRCFFEAGHAVQIIIAAVIAIAIGMVVNVTVDNVPVAATALVGIPGTLWLRALQAVGTSSYSHISRTWTGKGAHT